MLPSEGRHRTTHTPENEEDHFCSIDHSLLYCDEGVEKTHRRLIDMFVRTCNDHSPPRVRIFHTIKLTSRKDMGANCSKDDQGKSKTNVCGTFDLCSAVINLSPFLKFPQKRSNFELPFLRQKVTPVEITSLFITFCGRPTKFNRRKGVNQSSGL